MFIFGLILGAIFLSIMLNTTIKAVVYGDDMTNVNIWTVFGIVVVNNLIPLTLGCIIGLYAIL